MKKILILVLALFLITAGALAEEQSAGAPAQLKLTPPEVKGELNYGQLLKALPLEGGLAESETGAVAGHWQFETPEVILTPGTHSVSVRFVPRSRDYEAASCDISVTVRKTSPNIYVPSGSGIMYGQALSASVLTGGSAENPFQTGLPPVVGHFAWENSDYVPGVGDQPCNVVFTPYGNDEDLYYPVYFTINVYVARQNLTVAGQPAFAEAIRYPEPVERGVLVPGRVLDPAGNEVEGTWQAVMPEQVPEVGSEACAVQFEPKDYLHLAPVGTVIRLTVLPGEPRITLQDMTLPVGTQLKDVRPSGTAQNSMGETVQGVFAFAGDGTVAEGTHEYAVVFTPAFSGGYNTAEGSCAVTGVMEKVTVEAAWSGVYGMRLWEGSVTWTAVDKAGAEVNGTIVFPDEEMVPTKGTVEAQFVPLLPGYEKTPVAVTMNYTPREVRVTPLDEMNVFYPGTQEEIYYTLSQEVAVTGRLEREPGEEPGTYAVLPGTLAAAEEGVVLVLETGHSVTMLAPEKTETPEPTKAAEKTEAPEPTKAPEKTETPEPTKAPEATVTPEDAKTPEATEAPSGVPAPAADPGSASDESGALAAALAGAVPAFSGDDAAEAFVAYRDRGGDYLKKLKEIRNLDAFAGAQRLDISFDGTRAAMLKDGVLTVISLPDGEPLFTAAAQSARLFAFGARGEIYLDTLWLDPDTQSLRPYAGGSALPGSAAIDCAQPAAGRRVALITDGEGRPIMLLQGEKVNGTATLEDAGNVSDIWHAVP